MRAWVDIENAPQVQYLLPLARRFARDGGETLVTARAHGETFALLEQQNVEFDGIGVPFGRGLSRKLRGLTRRAQLLAEYVRAQSPPIDFVLTASRAATVAARLVGIPSFVILDYEHVDVLAYVVSGSSVLFPHVIDPFTFRRRGVRRSRLMPFHGLKEDITFADVDLDAVQPHRFDGVDTQVRVLVRPPAEDSHYFRRASLTRTIDVLRHLSRQDVRVVFSPRERHQTAYLASISAWRHDPVVLDEPVPFVPLLKSVDAVVSAGGTMLREAAYLGVPAYSIFGGASGAVDRFLASSGRLALLKTPSDINRLQVTPRPELPKLRSSGGIADGIAERIAAQSVLSRPSRPSIGGGRGRAHGTSAPAPSGDTGSSADPR